MPTVTASSSVVCVGGTVVLSATMATGTMYSWAEPDGNSGTGNTYTTTNIPASPNPYMVSVTATYMGCTGSASTYTITVNSLPTVACSATPDTIVAGWFYLSIKCCCIRRFRRPIYLYMEPE